MSTCQTSWGKKNQKRDSYFVPRISGWLYPGRCFGAPRVPVSPAWFFRAGSVRSNSVSLKLWMQNRCDFWNGCRNHSCVVQPAREYLTCTSVFWWQKLSRLGVHHVSTAVGARSPPPPPFLKTEAIHQPSKAPAHIHYAPPWLVHADRYTYILLIIHSYLHFLLSCRWMYKSTHPWTILV